MRAFHFWIGKVFYVGLITALSWAPSITAVAQGIEPTGLRTDTIYETNYQTNTVELYSARGKDLGVAGSLNYPTGLTFDNAGNLYVSSDDPGNYSIQKIVPNGNITVFANTSLSGPHALSFD